MARRAAVLDAYRRILSLGEKGVDKGNLHFYDNISGFVKGAQIVQEEYLSDGGLLVTLEVSTEDIALIRNMSVAAEKSEEFSGKPKKITLNEWYRIIERFVVFTKTEHEEVQ